MHDGADQMIMDREAIVRSWMTDVLSTGGIDRLDDLHIDRIDPGWKDRERWLEAGLEAFRVAIALRDKGHLPVDVALAEGKFGLVSALVVSSSSWENALVYAEHRSSRESRD